MGMGIRGRRLSRLRLVLRRSQGRVSLPRARTDRIFPLPLPIPPGHNSRLHTNIISGARPLLRHVHLRTRREKIKLATHHPVHSPPLPMSSRKTIASFGISFMITTSTRSLGSHPPVDSSTRTRFGELIWRKVECAIPSASYLQHQFPSTIHTH